MRRSTLFTVALLMAGIGVIAAPQPTTDKPKENKSLEQKPPTEHWAVIETNKGTIKFKLYEQDAPITSKNFIDLANRKFYDGLKFHRVVPGFVIQGGDSGKPEKTIPLEKSPKLKHDAAGVVAMARTPDPNSATSQYYITLDATPFLDDPPGYAVFGRVTEGMDVVRKIVQGDVMKTVRIIDAPTAKDTEKKDQKPSEKPAEQPAEKPEDAPPPPPMPPQ